MTVSWIHLVGLYLLIGTLASGLGGLAKLRLSGYEKPIFSNLKTKVYFGIGVVFGVLLWPVVVLLMPLILKLVRRRLKSKDKS